MTEEKMIRILGSEDMDERSVLDRLRFRRSYVTPEELRERLSDFLSNMQEVINGLPNTLGEYTVDTIVLTAEISAKGQISLLGTGGEIASKGGLSFTLKRLPEKPNNDATER